MEVKVKGIYKHFKGDYYLVEDIATHSEDGSKCVIYRSLYGDNLLWCRPYDLFISKVDKEKYPDCEQEYRYELVEIESKKNKH